MNDFKKVVAYIRVSTDQQDLSLEAQHYKLTALCQFHGLLLVDVFTDEDTSGKLPIGSRKGGKQMLDYLEKTKDIHGVIALRVDRMFRNDIDGLTTADKWAEQGIQFYASDVAGNTVNVKTSQGRLMFTIMLAFAVYEGAKISERTSDALQVKKRNRKVYGHAPYGFMADKDGNLIEVDGEIKTVKIVLNMHNSGIGFSAIASHLNKLKIPTKKGKVWHGPTVKNILTNSIYNDIKAALLAERKIESRIHRIEKPVEAVASSTSINGESKDAHAKNIEELKKFMKSGNMPVPSTIN